MSNFGKRREKRSTQALPLVVGAGKAHSPGAEWGIRGRLKEGEKRRLTSFLEGDPYKAGKRRDRVLERCPACVAEEVSGKGEKDYDKRAVILDTLFWGLASREKNRQPRCKEGYFVGPGGDSWNRFGKRKKPPRKYST